MLKPIVLFEGLWDSLIYAPLLLASLGGLLLGIGLFATRGWQPTCRRCRHDLRGVTDQQCPECGADLTARRSVRAGRRQVLVGRTILGALLIAAAALPHVGLTPYQVRSWLASGLGPREISRAAMAGSVFFQQIHAQRLGANDPEYRAAVIDDLLDQLETVPFTGGQWPQLQALDRLSSAAPLDGAAQRRIAAALVKRSETSATEAQAIARNAMFLRDLGDPEARSLLLTCDALCTGLFESHVPARVLRGQPISARCTWLGDMALGINVEPKVVAVRWRRAGDQAWTELVLEKHDRWTIASEVEHAGAIDVEVTAKATMPRSAALSPQPPRELTVVSVHRTEIVAPESLRVTPVGGPEVRASFEPLLSALQLRRFGSIIQPRFSMPGLRRSGVGTGSAPAHLGGRYLLLYDGKEAELGTYFHAQSGGGGGGGGGAGRSPLDGVTFEPGKPLVLRIVPDEAALRTRIDSDVSYVTETVELEFDGFDVPPREIRWIPPESTPK